MKKILILLAVVAVIFSCKNKPAIDDKDKNMTEISGKIENAGAMKVMVNYNNVTDSLEMTDQGEFLAKIMVPKPMYVYVYCDNFYLVTYVFPGTKVNFTANFDDFYNTLKFTGDNADINNYFVTLDKLRAKHDLYSEENLMAPEFETFRLALVELQENTAVELNNLAKKNEEKYADFVQLENERLKLYYIQMMMQYGLSNDSQDPNINIEIEKIAATTDFNNPGLLYTHDFMSCVKNYLNVVRMANREFDTDLEFAEAYFAEIDKILVEADAREELYYESIKDFILYYGPECVKEIYSNYKDFSSNKQRLTELEKIFAEYDKQAPGQPSVDWSFADINGKMYSLKDFKGKYVYIDVWASWCAPCKMEIPYLKKLKEKFANKNIAIIGISVDDNKADWEKIMKSENLSGIQLYAAGWENPLCEFFKINGIPRFILLDKEGKIINSNADRPSGDIETVLSNLEGI